MSKDTNFDKHSIRFKKNIYDTPKGQLRLQLVLDDLMTHTKILQAGHSLDILDAGCGMGQVALHLAEQGHRLTVCDISSAMIDTTQKRFEEAGRVAKYFNSSIQKLNSEHSQKYDLIVFHAVLEWLESPELIIPELKKRLKPGGYISLMFYNLNSIIFYNLLKGNFRKVMKQDFTGHPGGLTPTNPINPDEVDLWLKNNQISVHKKTGIRVLYDYLSKDMKHERSYEDLYSMESTYGQQAPFNLMGRYLHYICSIDKD